MDSGKEITLKDFPNGRTVYMSGEISDDSVIQFKKDLEEIIDVDNEVYNENIAKLNELCEGLGDTYKRSASFPPIILDITSPGGCVYSGLAMYDIIRSYNVNSSHVIIAKTSGLVASAATIVMLACDTRLSGKNTTFLIHSVSSLSIGKLQDLEDDLDETKRLADILKNIYTERTNIPYTRLEEIDKIKKDWILTANEAKECGLITSIF